MIVRERDMAALIMIGCLASCVTPHAGTNCFCLRRTQNKNAPLRYERATILRSSIYSPCWMKPDSEWKLYHASGRSAGEKRVSAMARVQREHGCVETVLGCIKECNTSHGKYKEHCATLVRSQIFYNTWIEGEVCSDVYKMKGGRNRGTG